MFYKYCAWWLSKLCHEQFGMGQESKAKAARSHSLTTLSKFSPLLITYLPLVNTGEVCNSFNVIRKNLHTIDISSATYLPRLFNVVKERPTKESKDFAWTELRTEVVRMLGLFASYPRVWGDHLKEILHVVCLLFLIEKKIKLCLICFAWLFVPYCEVVGK